MQAPPGDTGSDGGSAGDGGGHDAAIATDAARLDGGAVDAAQGTDASGIDAFASDDAGQDAFVPDVGDLPDTMLGDAGPSCPLGQSFCGGTTCIDLATDRDNCAVCGHSCVSANVLGAGCAGSTCMISACTPGYADLDRDPGNGCEVMQDFAMTLGASAITVSAGGTANVAVNIDRLNGFPYAISIGTQGLPGDGSLTSPGIALSTGSALSLTFTASSTALAQTYALTINAAATVDAMSVRHSATLMVTVTTSPIHITGVTVSDATGALPNSQARQGQGLVTLHVTGSGLLSASSATLEEFALTPVSGGTNTARDYTLTVDVGASIPQPPWRSLTLTMNSATGAATFGGAMWITAITASPNGNDAGRGSGADPFQTFEHALSVAGTGSIIALAQGVFGGSLETWSTPVPAGVISIGAYSDFATGAATLQCASPGSSSTATALRFASDIELHNLVIDNCLVAMSSTNVVTVTAYDTTIHEGGDAIHLATGSTLSWTRGAITGSTAMSFTGGAINFLSIDSTVGLTTTNTHVVLGGYHAHDVALGPAVQIGGSQNNEVRSSSFTSITGTALDIVGGSSVEFIDLQVDGATGAALHLGSSSATVDGFFLLLNSATTTGTAVLDIDGSAPSLVISTSAILEAITTVGTGVHIHVDPGSTGSFALDDLIIGPADVGILVDGGDASTHTMINADNLGVGPITGTGIRIVGGTTDLTANGISIGNQQGTAATLIDLVSGTGTFSIGYGGMLVQQGHGLVAEAMSRHSVQFGIPALRQFTIDVTGHPFDFSFAVEDHRISTTSIPPLSIRAVFNVGNGVMHTWSGVMQGIVGSYSSSVSPRDDASWFVGRSEASIDFGAP
jgi:hypothetical protein